MSHCSDGMSIYCCFSSPQVLGVSFLTVIASWFIFKCNYCLVVHLEFSVNCSWIHGECGSEITQFLLFAFLFILYGGKKKFLMPHASVQVIILKLVPQSWSVLNACSCPYIVDFQTDPQTHACWPYSFMVVWNNIFAIKNSALWPWRNFNDRQWFCGAKTPGNYLPYQSNLKACWASIILLVAGLDASLTYSTNDCL